jgi:hypothetical protein
MIRIWAILIALSVFVLGNAAAQNAIDPVAAESGVARRILVIGDVLAGGLGAGLTRMTEAMPHYDVTFRVNGSKYIAEISTGSSKP